MKLVFLSLISGLEFESKFSEYNILKSPLVELYRL